MVYPVAYAIIWTCPTAIRIYQSATGARAPLWITVIDKSCIVVQGLVDAIVYGKSLVLDVTCLRNSPCCVEELLT